MFKRLSRTQESGVFVHSPYMPGEFRDAILFQPLSKQHIVAIYRVSQISVYAIWDVKEQRQVFANSVSQVISHACGGLTETMMVYVGEERNGKERKVSLYTKDLMIADPEEIDIKLENVTGLVSFPGVRGCLIVQSGANPIVYRFDSKREAVLKLPFPNNENSEIAEFDFNPTSNLLCVSTPKNRIYVFDIANPDAPKIISADITSEEKIKSLCINGSKDNPVVAFCTDRRLARVNVKSRMRDSVAIKDSTSIRITDDGSRILLSSSNAATVYSKELRAEEVFPTSFVSRSEYLDSITSMTYIISSGNMYTWDLGKPNVEVPAAPAFRYPKIQDAWMHNNVHCEVSTPIIMINSEFEGEKSRLLTATNGQASSPTVLEGLYSWNVESIQIGPDSSMWIAYSDKLSVSTQYERGALDVGSLRKDPEISQLFDLRSKSSLKVKFAAVSPIRDEPIQERKIGYMIAVAFEGEPKVSIYSSMRMSKPLFEIPIQSVQACCFSKSTNTLALVQQSGRTLFFDVRKRLSLPLVGKSSDMDRHSVNCFWKTPNGKFIEIGSESGVKDVDRIFFDHKTEYLIMANSLSSKIYKILDTGIQKYEDISYGADNIAPFPRCQDISNGHFLVGISTGVVLVDLKKPTEGKTYYEWAQGVPLSICSSKDGKKVFAVAKSGVMGIWNRFSGELEGYMAILPFESEVVLYFTDKTGSKVEVPGGKSKFKYVTCAEHTAGRLPVCTQKFADQASLKRYLIGN